jgi:ribonuclease R
MTERPFPSAIELVEYITSQGGFVMRRDIARAFRIKGADRRHLKELLKELELKGQLERKGKSYKSKSIDNLVVVEFVGEDPEGDLIAVPIHDAQEDYYKSIILDLSHFKPAHFGVGDKLVVRVSQADEGHYVGKVIRKLEVEGKTLVGVIEQMNRDRWVIRPVNRRDRNVYMADISEIPSIQDGELVEAEIVHDSSSQRPTAIVREVLESSDFMQKKLSVIAIHTYDLPYKFPDDVLKLSERCQPPDLSDRIDLRHVPLVTIDDEDARDHDDAVWAGPDANPKNPGGWHIIVAIADVSYFVKSLDAIDFEALARSNSVYFPDQVIPMLPERLSNELCSLKPNVDRPCLAVNLYINGQGELARYDFFRTMIRSHGKLTYKDVQASIEQRPNKIDESLQAHVIPDLYRAYKVLKRAKDKRGPLDLDLPERKIVLSPEGRIESVLPRARFDSHRLIEEMMILANTAAAKLLSDKQIPTLYRVHDEPDPEKIEELRSFLKGTSVSLPKGQVMRPQNFNTILNKVADTPAAHAINELVLRSQAQAVYSPDNIGHFGLNLARYCHFTSPIRRYADLIVHRGILSLLEKDTAHYPYNVERLVGIGEEVSEKERRAAKAENETIDRYVAHFLEDRVGDVLEAKISGITEFAVFLTLEETGASGILPLRNLSGDYYQYDSKRHTLMGRKTKHKLTLGDRIDVRLESADLFTGGLVFSQIFNPTVKKGFQNFSKKGKKVRKS